MRIQLSIHEAQDVERLERDFMAILQEVEGVIQKVEPGLEQLYFYGREDFSTPNSISTSSDIGILIKEEVDALHRFMSCN